MIARMIRMGIAISVSIFLATPALAGGFYLYEVGTPDVGLAAAGYAARAQDASTAFTNPAGMTRLDRREIQFGVQPMYLDMKFSPDSSTTTTGPDGDASAWIPAGSMFYVQPVSKDLAFGFGVFGNFGLSINYGNDWVGRYYAQEVTLQGLTFMPSIAYRISPQISVGGGIGIMYATFKDSVAINNRPFELVPSFPDGQLNLEDHDWGVNGKFGILYEPTRTTRFGVTYTTQTVLKFSSATQWSGLGPVLDNTLQSRGRLNGRLNLGFRAPQTVMVSAFHDVTDRLALLANVDWEQWSKFGEIAVGISDGMEGGHNARAALMTRGLTEITRVGVAQGAEAETFLGLAGIGDLLLTCTGDLSRNRRIGLGLGRGRKLEEIVAELGEVAEGVQTTRAAVRLAARLGVEVPITNMVRAVIDGEKTPAEAGYALMTRQLRSERDPEI